MVDRFASPRQMLARGKHHVQDLETRIRAYIDSNPGTQVVERDSDGVTDLYKIRFTPPADDLGGVVFDAANNLRSVLDQLGFAIAVAHTGEASPTSCKFPFGPTHNDLLNNAKGACKNLPPEIRDLFIGFKAYKGGDEVLWALNELANTPKHKMIVPAVLGVGGTNVSPKGMISGPFSVERRWNRDKNELVFMTVGGAADFSYEANITYDIALDDALELIGGMSPLFVLSTMALRVDDVLAKTEAECRRIGLDV